MNAQNGMKPVSSVHSLVELMTGLGSRYLVTHQLVGRRLVLSVAEGAEVLIRLEAGVREAPESIATRWVLELQNRFCLD